MSGSGVTKRAPGGQEVGKETRGGYVESVVEATKQFDAFLKLDDDYKEHSSTRGTMSLVVFALIGTLVMFEMVYYLNPRYAYSYDVDTDFNARLKLNVDLTVKMNCHLIGADVIDETSNEVLSTKAIHMEDTWFEMSERQSDRFHKISAIYDTIRSNYHALHGDLWHSQLPHTLGPRETIPQHQFDACRIHGTYDLHKVAGNLHIVVGKSINFMGQRAHAINMNAGGVRASNFSHRIDDLSFGDNPHLVHSPLKFELKLAESPKRLYNYFLSIVSTEVSRKKTYQYAVTETSRLIEEGMQGTSGISFKYEISPLKVKVDNAGMTFWELIVSLIGIVGGVFATSIMLNSLFQTYQDAFASRKASL